MILTLEGLTKSYGPRRVLDGLNLRIGAGESVALLGANGSGKTTTLRCVLGLARVDGGRVTICGIDAAADPVRARAHLSYLPQKSVFPLTLTVRETLRVVAELRRLRAADVDREIELCALSALADRGVGELSGGERQRLAMAVAFLPPADLCLFDEPSANLDPTASKLLFRRAGELRRAGRTLLFTTHVAADVKHLASRVVFLRGGRIASEASGEFELRRCERMLDREMFGESDETSCDDGKRDGVAGDGRLRRAGAVA
jgi:ABC-type multidrug transport system ATPase subunit